MAREPFKLSEVPPKGVVLFGETLVSLAFRNVESRSAVGLKSEDPARTACQAGEREPVLDLSLPLLLDFLPGRSPKF